MKLFALAICALAVAAQDPETGFRQLWNQELLNKRPPAKNPAESLNRKATYKPIDKPAVVAVKKDTAVKETKKAQSAPPISPNDTVLGVTMWRLRPARQADGKNTTRLLILPPDGDRSKAAELVPERVDADTPMKKGERVRLTVEVPRNGYLYVIDREVFADGSTSDPYLIYPTRYTRQGENFVAAGRILEIPDSRDIVNHFELDSKPNQVAEQFSILVTPEPLPGNMRADPVALKVSEAEYGKWEKEFFVQCERWDLDGGAGKAWTETEEGAGRTGSKLTQDDPLPQTLYKITCQPGKAILVKVPIKVGK